MNKKELKEIEQIILKEEKDGEGIVCEENAKYRAYVNLKLKEQRGECMCKNWIEIKDGKIIKTRGLFKKGHYVVCLGCEEIIKIFKKETKVICSWYKRKRSKKIMNWTANFKKFRKKVESVFGDIELLAKNEPDFYTHMVLSHGFMEYAGIKKLKHTKKEYLKWARKNKLCEELLEKGWKEYLND